jgi:hypothetical protein
MMVMMAAMIIATMVMAVAVMMIARQLDPGF